MKTEIAFDVMSKILPDVVEIVTDPEIEKMKKELPLLNL